MEDFKTENNNTEKEAVDTDGVKIERMDASASAPSPEPKPLEKKRGGHTAALLAILFAVVAVGAGGYIVYDKVIAPQEKTNCQVASQETPKDDEKDQDAEISRIGFILRAAPGTFYVTKKGEVYLEPRTAPYHMGDDENGVDYYFRSSDYDKTKLPGKFDKYTITANDIDGFSTVVDGKDVTELTFEGYKLDFENISSIDGAFNFGQQSISGFNYAFIGADGSMGWIEFTPGYGSSNALAKANVVKDTGYKNVANVVGNEAATGFLSTARDARIVFKDGSQEKIDLTKINSVE